MQLPEVDLESGAQLKVEDEPPRAREPLRVRAYPPVNARPMRYGSSYPTNLGQVLSLG